MRDSIGKVEKLTMYHPIPYMLLDTRTLAHMTCFFTSLCSDEETLSLYVLPDCLATKVQGDHAARHMVLSTCPGPNETCLSTSWFISEK